MAEGPQCVPPERRLVEEKSRSRPKSSNMLMRVDIPYPQGRVVVLYTRTARYSFLGSNDYHDHSHVVPFECYRSSSCQSNPPPDPSPPRTPHQAPHATLFPFLFFFGTSVIARAITSNLVSPCVDTPTVQSSPVQSSTPDLSAPIPSAPTTSFLPRARRRRCSNSRTRW